MLKKEIDEDTRRWANLPCSWIDPKFMKTIILLEAILKFNGTSNNE
jgi:hypothetical protein